MQLTVDPLKHQFAAIDFGLIHNYMLNGDEMGLGKTLESIAVACAVEGKITITAPAFLKYNWKEEFLKFTDLKEKDINMSLTSSRAKVNIINYAKLKDAAPLFKDATLVVADEAHYLKNLEAQRTNHFHNYIEEFRPERLHLLSGTPIKNRVTDFYSILKLLSMTEIKNNGKSILDKFPTAYRFNNYFSNRRAFSVPIRGGNGRKVEVVKYEGVKNEAELKTYFRGKYIRRLAKEVLDLPELRRKTIQVRYGGKDSSLRLAWDGWRGDSASISRIKADSAISKINATIDYAKSVHYENGGKPIVIYSDHVDPVEQIARGLGKRVGIITGRTSMEERHSNVQRFQSQGMDYLVATIGAASTGLTLTAASDLIFNDLSWVPADNEQAEKRIHRIGQKSSCRIHFMSGSKVDAMIIKSLQSKQETINKLLL